MNIRDVMTREVETVKSDTSIREAAELMRDRDIGVLPVVDDGKVSGMLTDRDIVIRSTAAGSNPNDAKAGDAASADIAWCYDDDEVKEVVEKMSEHKVRRLPVMNRSDELVGIVSIGDVAVESSEGMAGEALEDISKPNRPK